MDGITFESKSTFKKLKTAWRVRVSSALLNLAGVGVCVPDFVFTHSEHKLSVGKGVLDYRRIATDRSDADARRLARQLCLTIDGRLPK